MTDAVLLREVPADGISHGRRYFYGRDALFPAYAVRLGDALAIARGMSRHLDVECGPPRVFVVDTDLGCARLRALATLLRPVRPVPR